ncbi:MAG: YdeI/OmpD-associated family protein [Candidatus Doudnabacteria bacterium]|nr:YdeI/OmpD-associated family protein [Candidatus Doudnabacteria bacterium]
MTRELSNGVVHKVPADLRKILTKDKQAGKIWQDLTPLARNEWICWVTSVTLPVTRKRHVQRVRTELREGMRRPCCWYGCPHRTDKPVSPSVQNLVLNKKLIKRKE